MSDRGRKEVVGSGRARQGVSQAQLRQRQMADSSSQSMSHQSSAMTEPGYTVMLVAESAHGFALPLTRDSRQIGAGRQRWNLRPAPVPRVISVCCCRGNARKGIRLIAEIASLLQAKCRAGHTAGGSELSR